MKFRTSVSIGSILLVAALTTGCGGGGNSTTLPDPDIKFVNALSDGSAVDFYGNDSSFIKNVPAASATAGFKTIKYISDANGGYDFSANIAGTTTELVRDYHVCNQNTHTINVVVGLTDPAVDQDKRVQQFFLSADRTSPNGKTRLLIINGLNQAAGIENQTINFQTYDPANPSSSQNPQFFKNNLVYGNFDSNNNVLDMDAGSFQFQARQSNVDGVEIFASTTFNFLPGKVYLALITGQVGSATHPPTITYTEVEPK